MKYERSRADANEVEETEGDPMQYGRFQRDLLTNVQGVWRVRMDERRLVCAVQRDGARTYFEVLDFGAEVEDLDERPSDAPSDNDSDGDNHSGEDGEEDADASGSGSEEDDGDSGHKRRKPAVRSRNFEASQTRSRRNGSGSHARSGASWRQSNRPSGLSALQQTSAGSSSLGVESRRVETPTSSHGPDFPEQQ